MNFNNPYGNPYGNPSGNQYPNPQMVNPGYGMGNPMMMNPGMGMGNPVMMNPGMGMGNPCALQGQYMFTRQMIDSYGRMSFMKYDFNRNGLLNKNELRMALNEFCGMNGRMPIMEPDFYMLLSIYDCDGSGSVDYFEYQMMLEHLGGLNVYDRNYLMQFRSNRHMRMQQYNSFW